MLEGIHEKKEHLDSVCEKYMTMSNRDEIYAEFVNVIGDISTIFDAESYPISQTRFKQKSDFYSLFAVGLQSVDSFIAAFGVIAAAAIAISLVSKVGAKILPEWCCR